MEILRLQIEAVTHQTYGWLRAIKPTNPTEQDRNRDRGAVSLEQVLWFVAAAVSAAVVATVLWNKIMDEANNTTITRSSTPPIP